MICTKCFTRMDACESCKDAELAAKDAEIARLQALVKKLRCCENCEHRGDSGYEGYECKLFSKKRVVENECYINHEFWEEGRDG